MITYELRVCIGRENSDKRIAVKCHDTGVNLMVFLEVCRPGTWLETMEPYSIPDGSTLVIKIAKPDKTYSVSEGELVNGGAFFELPPQAFTVAGVATAEVSIFGSDARRLTSATFLIEVPVECVCDCKEESGNYVDVMAEQIRVAIEAEISAKKSAETALGAARRAEEAAKRAEASGGGGTGGTGAFLPSGGKAGQLLYKKSDDDFDVEWRDLEIPEQYGLVTYDQDRTITVS